MSFSQILASFEKGLENLKEAEVYSDFNSDADTNRKSRRTKRARIVQSESEQSDKENESETLLPPFPPPPAIELYQRNAYTPPDKRFKPTKPSSVPSSIGNSKSANTESSVFIDEKTHRHKQRNRSPDSQELNRRNSPVSELVLTPTTATLKDCHIKRRELACDKQTPSDKRFKPTKPSSVPSSIGNSKSANTESSDFIDKKTHRHKQRNRSPDSQELNRKNSPLSELVLTPTTATPKDYNIKRRELPCDKQSNVVSFETIPPDLATPSTSLISSPSKISTPKEAADDTNISLANADFVTYHRYVIRSLTILKWTMKTLSETMQDMDKKLGNISCIDNTADRNEKNIEAEINLMNRFPLQSLEALHKLERELMQNSFRKEFTTALLKIGGSDYKANTVRLMERLFTNSVGAKYSWVGMKKKKVFSTLQLCSVILDVIGKSSSTNLVTEDMITKVIKDWLRHAPERLSREKLPLSLNAAAQQYSDAEDNGEDVVLPVP